MGRAHWAMQQQRFGSRGPILEWPAIRKGERREVGTEMASRPRALFAILGRNVFALMLGVGDASRAVADERLRCHVFHHVWRLGS